MKNKINIKGSSSEMLIQIYLKDVAGTSLFLFLTLTLILCLISSPSFYHAGWFKNFILIIS